MKPNFSQFARRLRFQMLPLLAGLILAPLMALAADSTVTFTDPISGINPPQVDARNFVNNTTWDIETLHKYQTTDTLNYTNEDTMIGSVGWNFDCSFGSVPLAFGGRYMSGSFLNDFGATIQAVDSSVNNPELGGNSFPLSYLWVSATNIVNSGTLIGDGGGEIRLTGVNVDLSLSTLIIGSFARGGSSFNSADFLAATAVYDEYWGVGVMPFVDSSAIWDGTVAMSPDFYVDAPCQMSGDAQVGFVATFADSISITNLLTGMTNITYTNLDLTIGTTNVPVQIFRQAVFVAISDTNIILANRFFNTGNPANLFRTANVRFTSATSGDKLYLADALASVDYTFPTNRGLLLNLNAVPGSNPLTPCTDPTYRPANYILEGTSGEFFSGSPGVGTPTSDFLYDANGVDFTNVTVLATYAGYSAYVDELASRGQFGTAVTNLPGKIIIDATNLNLSLVTITNEGAEITIHAGNFIDSTGAVVSCQNLSYNLGSAVGNLNVTNLASTNSIPTLFNGAINAFSALWTNGYSMLIPNYDTNGNLATITNNVEVDLHVLLVDATGLSTTEPVAVQDLILHSTNMLVSDSMDVMQTLLFDGQSLTLLGTLDLDLSTNHNLQNWTYLIAPTLLYFTNNGTLSIPQNARFGSDPPIYTTNTTPAIAAATGTLFETDTNGNGNVPPTKGITIGIYTYTFVNTITNAMPNLVKIAATFDGSMSNLIAAINHAAGWGTNYSANTPSNTLVTAGLLASHSFTVTAKAAGSSGNSIVTTSSTGSMYWKNGTNGTTLSGGAGAVTTNVVTVGGPYDAFVNSGSIIVGGSETINSTNYQISGSQIIPSLNIAPGGYSVTTSTGLVENASITSGQNVNFSAASLTLGNSTITAGRQLNFNVTGNLTDMGCSSGNTLACGHGFNLPLKPATGDLPGTSIQSTAASQTIVTTLWAGVDYGATNSGYTNNVAIGRLILDAQGTNSSFRFNGAGVSNAIYVDSLVLLDYASYTNHDANGNMPMIVINPNLVIYYADAINGDGEDVTKKLNHKNGNHFQWVTNYTGCFASSPPSITTNVVGVVQPQLSANIGSGRQFQLTVNGAADQTYILQDSADLTNWVNICTGMPPFTITNTANYPTRFYRAVTN